MALRSYEGDGIVVHWDSDRCAHSQRCVNGAPSVFDWDARPWVTLDGAAADDVAAVIDTCPSGALSYTRTDGAPNGRRGRAVGDDPTASTRSDIAAGSELPSVTPLRNGPLAVRGPITLADPDGTLKVLQHARLCRCGQSASKPICDGSHARVGFIAEGVGPS